LVACSESLRILLFAFISSTFLFTVDFALPSSEDISSTEQRSRETLI